MKKIYYIYVCLGVLLLTALPAKAASEAEFGKLAKTYTLHKDGSQEMRVYKELTLFTHAAMNGLYGESFIVYNPAYQELKIHESYTRQKDGKIVKTPENAFVEVLPAAAADAPAYNGLKEMVVYIRDWSWERLFVWITRLSHVPVICPGWMYMCR